MPLKYLRYLMLLAMLISLHGTAQQVPVRALLAEQVDAGQGEAAIVHTHYGTGYGFFLTGKAEVLVARHSVLTPQRTIANEIDVKYPQRPFNNFVESRSVPIAQDIVHDLVLLHVENVENVENFADVGNEKANAVLPVQVPVATPPCTPLQQVRYRRRHTAQHSWHSNLHQARFTRRITKESLHRTLAFRRNPRLHIIWDGPDTGSS